MKKEELMFDLLTLQLCIWVTHGMLVVPAYIIPQIGRWINPFNKYLSKKKKDG